MNTKIKILLPSFLSFFLISIICFYLTDKNLYIYTSDFFQYHGHAYNLLNGFNSNLSDKIVLLDEASSKLSPSPFYALVFLSPITIFGSKDLFFLEGLILGFLNIYNIELIISKINNSLNNKIKAFLMLIITIFPSFILETITVSNISVAVLFILLAFNVNNRFLRIIFFVFASMIRANYIIALFSLIIVLLVFKPRLYKQLILDLIPSLAVYLINYKFFYSTYQGSGFNYLLTPLVPSLTKFSEYSDILFRDALISENVPELNIEKWNANPFKVLKLIFSSEETFSYTLNLMLVKISLTLGFLYDSLLSSNSGFWLIKPFRTIYFAIFTLPGAYCTFLALFLNRFSVTEKSLFSWSLLFLILNSILVATPKYFVGTHFIVIYSLFIIINEFLKININNSRYDFKN